MAKKAFSAKAADSKLADFGITVDWEKWKTFNYVQFFTAVKTVVDLLTNLFTSNQGVRGGPTDPAECAEGCIEHFECIISVAECGKQCCEAATA